MKSLLAAFQGGVFGLVSARLVGSPGLEPMLIGALAFPLADPLAFFGPARELAPGGL